MLLHSVFDVLAVLAAVAVFRLVPARSAGAPVQPPWTAHPSYLAAASIGAAAGAYVFGTCNLWLTGIAGVGRSIEGGIAGGILAIELLKRRAGIRGSTGVRLAAPLAAAIAVGRIGCFSAGLEDMTYGTPTHLPWGTDFGDGVPRHPVQLYESITMAVLFVALLVLLRRGSAWAVRSGFYLFGGVYAAQRFVWEFFKPYGTVIGPFNLFHLLSVALLAYAFLFIRRERLEWWTTQSWPQTRSA